VAEPVRMTIPASVACFVRSDTPLQDRMRGAGGAVDLLPRELVLLLFCLGKDSDSGVRSLAAATMSALDHHLVSAALEGDGYHPAVLHALAMACGTEPDIRAALLARAELADVTRNLLEIHDTVVRSSVVNPDAVDHDAEELPPLPDLSNSSTDEEATGLEAEESADEAGEEYLSKYQLAQVMSIGEKIKMALSGDKEWRKILVKDANKLRRGGVIKNPRMSEPEVLTVLKAGVQNDEIMRLICANKEWVKNYQIRKALIENPKTPLANALRYLGTMSEKDLATYAKSRNISSVVATQAKRMLLTKKR